MEILLVDPAAYDERGQLVQRESLAGRAAPLGLRVVAALTPPEHRVTIVEETLAGSTLPPGPDLVGIRVNTFNARRAYELADVYRRSGVPVVMGGVHASLAPDEAAGHADSVVVGEAETSWPGLLDDLAHGRMRDRYRADAFADLSRAPLPRYDLVPMDRYHRPVLGAIVAYETARGCPHECEFCVVPDFYGRRYRPKPVDQVVRELVRIREIYRDVRPLRFFFVDDNLCTSPRRSRELFDALAPLGIEFGAMLATDVARDEDLVRRAARAGLRIAFLGLESVSRSGLESVGKRFIHPRDFDQHLAVFARHGIVVEAAIIFGLETDGEETFGETLEFLTRHHVAIGHFEPLTPLPGTALYRRFEREGRLLHPRYWLDPAHDIFALFRHDRLSAERFAALYRETTTAFYSMPSILRRLAAAPNRRHAAWLLPYNLVLRSLYRADGAVRA